MKKIIVSVIALAALTGGAYASNDASNGYASRNITADVFASHMQNSGDIVDPASVIVAQRLLTAAEIRAEERGTQGGTGR